MNKELRVRLLLAMQASLIGYVSSNIRGVSCGHSENDITIVVVFDGEISDDDREAMEEVGSEMASHFGHEKVKVQCVRVDAPAPFRNVMLEHWAYGRRES
ncbi:UNVERIFIED_ORG: hypothetical protein ABIC54_002741 [Burkholderia sp. 1263]